MPMSSKLRDQNEESIVVSSVSQVQKFLRDEEAEVKEGNNVKSRNIKKVATSSMGLDVGGGGGNASAVMGDATNIYSPHMGPDFLEKPQNRSQARSYYRYFYNNDPYVGQAIDLHTELPLSKLRLGMPKSRDPDLNREVYNFFQNMVDRLDLLEVLEDATREYYVIGEAFIFAEDSEVEVPEWVYKKREAHLDAKTGETEEKYVRRKNASELIKKYKKKNYKGWNRLLLLPPERVEVETYSYVDKVKMELKPDEKIADLVNQSVHYGDEYASDQIEDIPDEIIQYILDGENLPLGTDPDEGSFVFQLARKRPPGEDHGVSILKRCLNTLVYRDKLRQAQTSIASRAMTPKRLIYAEDMDEYDVEDLREQVDMALLDPDYSIITNFDVNWEEINARDRLLDLNSEYDITDRQLFAGLGVTESMLTGESTYSGERINIEVINTRYMLYREQLQKYVEEKLFKPVARKKGFVTTDEYGNEKVIYPSLSFTRLALRDNRDTFDALFNLYQKGSLSVEFILELFNLDPQVVRERLQQDLMTVNDPLFNEVMRSAYGEVGRSLNENSDMADKIASYLGLEYEEDEDDGGRF